MTGEFSRRSFLKYTALTAVAVAGSSLLSGCEYGYNPVQTEIGTTNVVLKAAVTLNTAVYDAATKTAVFELALINGRKNALNITSRNFTVTAGSSYCAHMDDKIKIVSADRADPQIPQNGTATYKITVTRLDLAEGDTLRFTFYPDLPEYTEYSANWDLTAAKMKAGTAAGSGS